MEYYLSVYEVIPYVILGSFLGAIGQGARAFIGIRKSTKSAFLEDKKIVESFDFKRYFLSLSLGAIFGAVGSILLLDSKIDRQFLFTLLAFGYSGTDFAEGLIKSEPSKPPLD